MTTDEPSAGASRARRIEAISALADPARRALFDLVTRSDEPLTRDAAAAATGLSRSTVAAHLDRLADEGLVEVRYRRLTGRTGPGAGRPSKLYGRADAEVTVSLPDRHYDLLGHLLASAIEDSVASGMDVASSVEKVAGREGRELGAGSATLLAALEQNGYEPLEDGNDVVAGNCPFHAIAREHTELVCRLNRALVEGMDAVTPGPTSTIATDPLAGRCCVRISEGPS